MIKSMTGYGKAEIALPSKKFTVEIRSLNSKQLDLSVKIPSMYRAVEYDIRGLVAKSMVRGKVDLYVNIEQESSVQVSKINKPLFGEYYQQLNEVISENSIPSDVVGDLVSTILKMPDVLGGKADVATDEECKAIITAVNGALDQINNFREQEGKVLMDDILRRVDLIDELKCSVEPFESMRVEIVKNRIRENIASLNIPFDSNRLEQEMIFYIEKLDITEEKVRLTNHCKYFHEVVADEQSVGRKLGFISQEIGREINTMGSKANESNIQKIVVRMKDELEKIKEQLLNIL